MITQKENESRKNYLIRVVIEFITDNATLELRVKYDGATCDGYCLVEDLTNVLDEDNS